MSMPPSGPVHTGQGIKVCSICLFSGIPTQRVGSLQPNWVGYMINGFNQSNLMAYDYATAGNNITGYTSQVRTEFIPTAGQKPVDIPWTADNSILISWIGINDLASATVSIESTISQIVLTTTETCYGNLPRSYAMFGTLYSSTSHRGDRSPLGATNVDLKERILTWNAQLAASALAFSNQNTDASTLVYTVGGDIWKGDLHPTSAVHHRFANDLAGWLLSLPAGASNPTTTTAAAGVKTATVGVSATVTVYVPLSQTSATVLPSPQSGSSSSSCNRKWTISWTCLGLSLGLPIYNLV
ncbi:hypothetical protein OPQ81_005189 [Rhizoctonia solani]|nr:hypothetical protein OPQ81_005189 [Rhizoctonia solani]